MTAWLLDTALLAIPNYGLDRPSAEEIIARTFDVFALVTADVPVRFYQNDAAQDMLWGSNCGPDFENIKEFLALVALDGIYAANDVLQSYNTIFDRCPYVSELGAVVENFVFSSLTPNPISGQTPTELADETRRCIVNAGISIGANRLVGIVPGWKYDGSDSVAATYDISSYSGQLTTETCGQHTQEIPLLVRPILLARHRLSNRIWSEAQSSSDIHLAILVRGIELQLSQGRQEAEIALIPFHVGSEFFSSLEPTQTSGQQPFADICLDVCGQLVAGTCNRFQGRMGKGGQIVRDEDGAGAMRVHLTDSHDALRLMYWKVGDSIEFANVGPKFELIIRDGEVAAVTNIDPDLVGA